jgi:hypothetical protein
MLLILPSPLGQNAVRQEDRLGPAATARLGFAIRTVVPPSRATHPFLIHGNLLYSVND